MLSKFVERSDAAVADAAGDGRRWYACYTMAQRERKVDAQLRACGIRAYLPLVPRTRQWHDRKKVAPFPMFPSYVFARFGAHEMASIVSTAGVASVVRFGDRLAVIPDEEIDNIARFARVLTEGGHEPPAATRFEEGQRVQIVSGPFAGILGVVLESRGRSRVLVGLETIGLGFEVDVPAVSLTLPAHSQPSVAAGGGEGATFSSSPKK